MAQKKKQRPTTDTRNVAQRIGGYTIAPYMLKMLGYDKAADVVGFPNYLEKEEKIHKRGMRKRREDVQSKRRPKKKATGGSLKSVPESNTGLKKLPTAVRNKMGYMQKGGSCKGMGKAVRGGNFSRNG